MSFVEFCKRPRPIDWLAGGFVAAALAEGQSRYGGTETFVGYPRVVYLVYRNTGAWVGPSLGALVVDVLFAIALVAAAVYVSHTLHWRCRFRLSTLLAFLSAVMCYQWAVSNSVAQGFRVSEVVVLLACCAFCYTVLEMMKRVLTSWPLAVRDGKRVA